MILVNSTVVNEFPRRADTSKGIGDPIRADSICSPVDKRSSLPEISISPDLYKIHISLYIDRLMSSFYTRQH